MNTNLLAIIKQIVAEQGEGILADAKRLFPFFADYAKSEHKEDRVAFGRCIEYGAYQELKKTSAADERRSVKAALADQINAKTGIARPRCADALDLLEAVIFKTEQQSFTTPSQTRFCKNCGKELQKGWEACPYCSTPAAKAGMQTGWQGSPQNAEMPKNIKILLLIAAIIGSIMCLIFLISPIFLFDVTEDGIMSLVFGTCLGIATILIVRGQRKNNRKMILAAGIVYFISFIVGTPSAILCFIAYAKMGKKTGSNNFLVAL